jgi:hypothetical protein
MKQVSFPVFVTIQAVDIMIVALTFLINCFKLMEKLTKS